MSRTNANQCPGFQSAVIQFPYRLPFLFLSRLPGRRNVVVVAVRGGKHLNRLTGLVACMGYRGSYMHAAKTFFFLFVVLLHVFSGLTRTQLPLPGRKEGREFELQGEKTYDVQWWVMAVMTHYSVIVAGDSLSPNKIYFKATICVSIYCQSGSTAQRSMFWLTQEKQFCLYRSRILGGETVSTQHMFLLQIDTDPIFR